MGSRKLRQLFWGCLLLVDCTAAVDDRESADGGSRPEVGSGGSPVAGSGGSRAGAGGVAAHGGNVAAAGQAAAAGSGSTSPAAGSGGTAPTTEKFSFFVTSLDAMTRLSKSDKGFGGDLRYGETTGLAGADKICTEIAESAMPGAGAKVWHAFLSAKSAGPSNGVVHAKDRIGTGPWYDRLGHVVAMDLAGLLETRPEGDAAISDNLPNESGQPNRMSSDVDNHDTVTGSNELGEYSGGGTCEDWTTTTTPAADSGSSGRGGGRGGGGSSGPMCGHSWPAQSGQSWIKAHNAPGCAPSVSIVQMGGGSGDGIGNAGGYGGIYCFALTP